MAGNKNVLNRSPQGETCHLDPEIVRGWCRGAVYWRLHRGPHAKPWALQMNQPVCRGTGLGLAEARELPLALRQLTEGTGEKEQS